MLLYYITDRTQFPGDELQRRRQLLDRIAEAAHTQIDFIQLREKDLPACELEQLAAEALHRVRDNSAATRLLINSRTDIALAVGLDGVHLTSSDLNPAEVRTIHAIAVRNTTSPTTPFLVAASCHSPAEVRLIESHGADFVVLAPIFEKIQTNQLGIGLEAIRAVTLRTPPDLRVEAGDNRVGIPVLALGGVTVGNAATCMAAGAAGIAGIRVFQQGNLPQTVQQLRTAQR